MSFIAKLELDGEEMNVLHCDFRFTQSTDATGKPIAIPKGGHVNLVVESNGGTDLFDWMISATMVKTGVVTFYRRDTMSKLKTLKFVDAVCIDYFETYDHTGDNPMQVQVTVSAHEIQLNNSFFVNDWPNY